MSIAIRIMLFLMLCTTTFSCLPRCTKLPAFIQCRVRMRHMHSGMEFRGVPWYKKQNMQYGEKYKQKKKDDHQHINSPRHRKRNSKRRVIIRKK